MGKLPEREWDWISAGLLFILIQVAAARLVTTDWAPFLYWTETLAGSGTALGLALGASRFRGGAMLGLMAGYTTVVLPWQLTRSATDEYLLDRLSRVADILALSLNQFIHGQPVKDSLLFLLFVCLAFWLIGVSAGYLLARQGRILASITLAGSAVIIIQAYGNYQPRGSWWLAIYAFVALLLAGRVHFLQRKVDWVQARLFVSEESGTNVLASLLVTAAFVILTAWWIPSSPGSLQRAADAWNTFFQPIRDRLSNAVTSLRGPYGKPGANFYGSSLALGQKAASGDSIALTVDVIASPELKLRYYWRGRVYSSYAAGLWSGSTSSRLLMHPNQAELGIPDAAHRSEALFLITSQFPTQSLVYGPSPMVWIDRAADVAASRTAPNTYDAISWEAKTTMSAGTGYEVRARLRNPTVQELRAAGVTYPSWVEEQYLGIPESDRPDLRRLADEITADHEGPYEKAVAITSYLRRNIEYSENVPEPPDGQDPVVWVLMNHKKGFCNYYASAEVLLLRSIGIPARLAAGFARGDLDNGLYTVHTRDAHAWPEAYFPGIGWVEFEPTANQDPLVRPSAVLPDGFTSSGRLDSASRDENGNRIPEDVELAPPAPALPFSLTPIGRAVNQAGPILVVLVAMALAYRLRLLRRLPVLLSRTFDAAGGPAPAWVRNWGRWNELEPVEHLFASVSCSLRLLGKPQPTHATPAARAGALSRLLPSAASQIEVLRRELEAGLFTGRPPDLRRARMASALVLLHGMRAGIHKTIAALDGRTVYSDSSDTQTPA